METNSQIIIYQTESGETRLEVRLENETVWLTQKLMSEPFQTTPQNITIHLKNVFDEGELSEAATCKDFLQVRREGARTVERHQLAVEKAESEYEKHYKSRKNEDRKRL